MFNKAFFFSILFFSISTSHIQAQLTLRGADCKYYWFGDLVENATFSWNGECISNLVQGEGDMEISFDNGFKVILSGKFIEGYPSGMILEKGIPQSGASYSMTLKFEDQRIVEKSYVQTELNGQKIRVECLTNELGSCYQGTIHYHNAIYYGEMQGWLRHGDGKIVYPSTGQCNEGIFEEDFPIGFHTKKTMNGTIIDQGYALKNESYYDLENSLNLEPPLERIKAARNLEFGSVIKYSKYYKICGRAISPETTFPVERKIYLKVIAVDKSSGMLTCKMTDFQDINTLECIDYEDIGDVKINGNRITYGQLIELDTSDITRDYQFEF